jgi:hypothetical protein
VVIHSLEEYGVLSAIKHEENSMFQEVKSNTVASLFTGAIFLSFFI